MSRSFQVQIGLFFLRVLICCGDLSPKLNCDFKENVSDETDRCIRTDSSVSKSFLAMSENNLINM